MLFHADRQDDHANDTPNGNFMSNLQTDADKWEASCAIRQ